MNKTELIQEVTARTGEKKVVVEKVLNTLFTTIPEVLAAGKDEEEKIQITGFGSFSTSYTKGREGRNPKDPNGAKIEIPASYRVYFSAGQCFKDTVNDRVEKKKETSKKIKVAKK